MDVINTPGGMDQLRKLNVRRVPVVVVGDRYIFAQDLKAVAGFLDIPFDREALPPEQLVAKYLEILATAQRMVPQIPADKMDERVIPNRPRTLRPFGYHIFRVAETYLMSYDGAELTETLAQAEPVGGLGSAADVVEYGRAVRDRLANWWRTTTDKACTKPIRTYYGVLPAHEVLERCTWHSAQHVRQLAAVLERFGIAPDGPPTPELLAGLPLPEGLWE